MSRFMSLNEMRCILIIISLHKIVHMYNSFELPD